MKVLADISVIPLGVGVSLSAYIAACERVLREAGLDPKLHAFGTEVEGDWDVIMAGIRACHDAVHGMGAPRVTTTVKLSTRIDRDQSLDEKVVSVQTKL
jgi:uncharacterized protein (TIGR00106 family)